MLLASGEVSSKHPGAPSFLGEADSSVGLAPSVTPLTPPLPLQQQQPCNCWPYAPDQAAGGLTVGTSACRGGGGSPIQPAAGPLTGPMQLPVGAGGPPCLGVEGSRLASTVAPAAVDGAAATGGPSPAVWVSGGAPCSRGPMQASCPSPCAPVASYPSCHVPCVGKPLQQPPIPCYPSLLMGASLGPAGQVVQHPRSSPQGPLMSQQPPQHSVLLQQHLVQQQPLVQQPVLQNQLLQQPGGSLSVCLRPEAVNMITAALRRYLVTVVSEVYREVARPWRPSGGCCSQLQHLPLCRKDHEGGNSPIGTSSTATTSGGLEEDEESAFCSSTNNTNNIAASASSTNRCGGEPSQAPLALSKGQSPEDTQAPRAQRPSTAAAAAAAAPSGDDSNTEGTWSLLCKKEAFCGSAASAAAPTGAAAAPSSSTSAVGEQAYHLQAIRNGPSEQLAKYVTLLLPFLSDSPQELRARNPQCFVEARMQLEALRQRQQEQPQYQQTQQMPLQPQHHQQQMPVQHQHLPMPQQPQHPPIPLQQQQQQQQPVALQQQPHQQPIALQQHRQMPLQQQPEMRLHHPQQLSLQQQPQQDVAVEAPQQLSLQRQQLPTLLQQQQQLTRPTGIPTSPAGFAAGCCSALREHGVAGAAAGGTTTTTAAAGFRGADGPFGGPIVPPGWQGAEAATAGEGVRGEVRSRPPWPVDESLRWGPHAASSCAGGPSFGFMGAPAAAGSAGKGECATSCSSGNADAAALVQLSRPTLPSSIPASAAGEGASAAAGDCLVPRMNLGAVGSCSHDGLNSGSRVMMPWGSRAGVPRPSPPPLGQLVALDSPTPATSASPPCMWPVSPSASTTAAPNSLATTPTAGTGSGVTGPVGVLPNRKKLVPAELGSVISAEGLGRSPRGNVRVCHSQPHNAWLVLCCAGGAESRAFSVLQLGYEGAKRVALLYAAQCRRHLNSRRAAAQKPAMPAAAVAEAPPERPSKVKTPEDTSAELAATGLGSTGPPGGCFNLIDYSGDVPYTTRSDVSASRVARLSRRAMELPYVHGVRFEAETFAWVAQMRGEARRFLVKKHGFIKSRLCAVEKIQAWRATLPPAALEQELKVEQEVLEMLRTSGANPASSQPMPLGPPLQQLPAPDFRETSASLDF